MRLIALLTIFLVASAASANSIDTLISRSTGLTAEQARVVQSDLDFFAQIKGSHSSKLSDQFFGTKGTLEGAKYLEFILSRVSRFNFNTSYDGPVLGAFQFGTMDLTPSYFKQPQAVRTSVLIHEAAHADNMSHAYCPIPFVDKNGVDIVSTVTGAKFEGKPACADFLADAYIVQIVFLKNVVKCCKTCSEQLIAEQKTEAETLFKRILSPALKLQLIQDQ